MSESIQPLYRRGEARSARRRRPRLLPVLLLHFGLAGAVLLLAGIGVMAYLYTLHFTYIDIGWSLRFERAGDLYAANIQMLFAGAVLLEAMSLVQFAAFRALAAGSRDALRAARAAALALLLGFPAAYFGWQLELDLPGIPASTVRTGVRIMAGLVAFQALLALGYSAYFALPGARRVIHRDLFVEGRRTRWAWARGTLIGVGAIAVAAAGITLAMLTDVIELRVDIPLPGALLYATSFDGPYDRQEWDLYEGRDSAQIIDASRALPGGAAQDVSGQALVLTHASPTTQEVIFSALDRKYSDVDLSVTARMLDGPEDNQYGVVFRFRDDANYYAFFISADGYYSLVKRENGVLRDISTWGVSDAVARGKAPNTLRVIAQGDTFRFFVNGQIMPLCLSGGNAFSMWNPATGACATSEAVTTYHDADFPQGGVALAAGTSIDLSSPVVIAFDNLTITGPMPETATMDPAEDSAS